MEIEVRAFVSSLKDIENKLLRLNAKKIETTDIEDVWFCRQEFQSFKEVKQDKVGSYGLRVRLQKGKRPELNVKVLIAENDHNIFKEHETQFESYKEMKQILESIGFKVFCILKKKRMTYGFDNMKINLENIEGFPACVEIEIINDKDFARHKKTMHDLLSKLGIKENNMIKKSITALFMERYSFKQRP